MCVIKHAQPTCLVDPARSDSTVSFSCGVAQRVVAPQPESTRKMYATKM